MIMGDRGNTPEPATDRSGRGSGSDKTPNLMTDAPDWSQSGPYYGGRPRGRPPYHGAALADHCYQPQPSQVVGSGSGAEPPPLHERPP